MQGFSKKRAALAFLALSARLELHASLACLAPRAATSAGRAGDAEASNICSQSLELIVGVTRGIGGHGVMASCRRGARRHVF